MVKPVESRVKGWKRGTRVLCGDCGQARDRDGGWQQIRVLSTGMRCEVCRSIVLLSSWTPAPNLTVMSAAIANKEDL